MKVFYIPKFFEKLNEYVGTLSYAELSKRTGYSANTISGVLKGKHEPRLETAFCLCEFFGVSLDGLLNHTGCRYYCEDNLPCERFKKVREMKKISIDKLSKKTGVACETIWRFENNQNDMKLFNALKLAVELDFSLDWLCGR